MQPTILSFLYLVNNFNHSISNMKTLKYLFLSSLLLVSTFNQLKAQFKSDENKAKETIDQAIEAFEDLTDMEEDISIPLSLLRQAEGMVIFPKALKIAMGIGGQGGRGIAMVKKDDGSWSNPYFIGMGEANIGAQIGIQSTELILIFKDKEHILDLEKGDLTLGGDVGIAVGPMGRNSSASTDIGFEAEIYSYSKSKGLYVGISLEGTVLKSNEKLNHAYYDKRMISMDKVFHMYASPFNPQVDNLVHLISLIIEE
jgi:lipid-binding SYLF domain-containing protein